MIPIEDARRRLCVLARPLDRPAEIVPIAQASGRRLAESVRALRTQPARPLSAMDGYALAAADAGKPLRLAGTSAAGARWRQPIGPGETVRIFTGAALPPGADCVLIQENVERAGDHVRQVAGDAPRPGRHVRAEGSDFRAGDTLLRAGRTLDARAVALAIAGGHGEAAVSPRVRVATLSTGDELVPPGTAIADDDLPASNAAMVGAMVEGAGAVWRDHGIVRDDPVRLRDAIRAACDDADILVTSGGASVGDHDLVRPAMEAAGGTISFWRVAMRPGKPLIVGRLGDTLIMGLPGNPVSAYVTALLFVLPLVRLLEGAGSGDAFPATMPMRLATALPPNDGRTDHLRAVRSTEGARPVGPNDSAALGGLAAADLLIVRAPGAPAAEPGDMVDILFTA